MKNEYIIKSATKRRASSRKPSIFDNPKIMLSMVDELSIRELLNQKMAEKEVKEKAGGRTTVMVVPMLTPTPTTTLTTIGTGEHPKLTLQDLPHTMEQIQPVKRRNKSKKQSRAQLGSSLATPVERNASPHLLRITPIRSRRLPKD